MSATEFIDKALADSGEYAVYGKALGDKMRAGVQYGPDTVKPPRPLYSVYSIMNPNSARIAEIDREVEALRAQLASYDMEEEMGQYKFLYDNDPSVLTNYRQRKSTEQMNADMRKATEAANKASNLQTAWKQNGIDLETAKYDLLTAKQAYDEANGAADSEAVKRAEMDLNRAMARYNRVSAENKTLKSQMMKSLGVLEDDEAVLENEAKKLLDDYFNNGKGDPKEDPPGAPTDVAEAEAIQQLDGELNQLTKSIKVDKAIERTVKNSNITKWKTAISNARTKINNSKLSISKKNEFNDKITDLENQLKEYIDKQPIIKTKEELRKQYQKELDGLNLTQLRAKGYKWLKEAYDLGATNPYLNENLLKKLKGE